MESHIILQGVYVAKLLMYPLCTKQYLNSNEQ